MRLHLIRHADPDYENDTITDRGHEEAKALAARMAVSGLTKIYTSPMGRARRTASYTAAATGLEPAVLPWAAELTMDRIVNLDGRPIAAWNIAGEVVRGNRNGAVGDWSSLPDLAGYPFLERQEALAKASDEFLAEFGYRRRGGVYEVGQVETEIVAVFCHAGLGLSWLAHLLAIPPPLAWCGFFWAPTAVTTILMEMRSPRIAVPRALTVGDTSHIYAEGLEENNRGLLGNRY